MKDDLPIKNGITIPGHELEITASRAGGPGGQHVNKTSTRITVRWNIQQTTALDDKQKERVLKNLKTELTTDGDILLHSSASRSQQQNKKAALERLADKLRNALYVPKKRRKMGISKRAKAARMQAKKQRGVLKKMRGKKYHDE
ncbi:aminoacyl-tRNA hydrolase [Candidatus Dependentiae bacterium]|nr:MAG: aminoacyl-tRNA hydrolase [Candidatus Dependentiae bacterium]